MSHLFIPRPIDGLTTVRGPAARAARVCASGLIVEYARRTYFGIGPASGYAAGLISVVALFLPITPKASGIVVRPPTNARASPAALRWSLFSLLESKSPIPAPRATRVPAMRMISAILSFRSIIVPPTFVPPQFQLVQGYQSFWLRCGVREIARYREIALPGLR